MGPTVGQAAKHVSSNTQLQSALLKEDKAKKIIKLPHGTVVRIKRTNVHGALGTVPVPRTVCVSIRHSYR